LLDNLVGALERFGESTQNLDGLAEDTVYLEDTTVLRVLYAYLCCLSYALASSIFLLLNSELPAVCGVDNPVLRDTPLAEGGFYNNLPPLTYTALLMLFCPF
jgi:hypothetical protein